MYIRTPSGKRRQLGQEVGELIRRLHPLAKELGDASFLESLRTDGSTSGASWQRARFREIGDWKSFVGEMKTRFEKELQPAA
jgi:gamma-glutamyl:cysteine ligase YbdK (ATP-grasp superfamily)